MVYNGKFVGMISVGYTRCASGVPDIGANVGHLLNFMHSGLY